MAHSLECSDSRRNKLWRYDPVYSEAGTVKTYTLKTFSTGEDAFRAATGHTGVGAGGEHVPQRLVRGINERLLHSAHAPRLCNHAAHLRKARKTLLHIVTTCSLATRQNW